MRKQIIFLIVPFILNFSNLSALYSSEVLEETRTQVLVREHPKTGKPYVSITSFGESNTKDPFEKLRSKISRPDYRMLDPNVKPGQIPYEGPYSSAKKVYIFAATLATLGVAGGAIGLAVAPAAATASGAASGGGALIAGGSAVAAGSAGSVVLASKSDPKRDDFILKSESRAIDETETCSNERDICSAAT